MTLKHKRVAATATAASLAVTMLLGGTFAWQSISQMATNETDGTANPGGRLHDYFNGENKDVFVENFTDPNDGGVPIYARIKLSEYMEIGEGAGTDAPDKSVTIVGKTASNNPQLGDTSTWITHLPGQLPGGDPDNDHTPMHEYWEWEMGGKTVYMPTFNKDKDSLDADINGTYVGEDGYRPSDPSDTDDKYSDYVVYGNAYQEDGKTLQEPVPDNGELIYSVIGTEHYAGGVTQDSVTHYGKETSDAKVINMAEWQAMPEEEQIGPYWVYDADGWAYWAQPIQPGETTGLLLSGIKPQREPDDAYYYAIHVTGQFATAGDWGDKDGGTGFYEDGMTADGEHLLNKVSDRLPEVTQITVTGGYKQYVAVGDSLTLTANVSVKNPTDDPAETYVQWSSEEAGSALQGNVFTPTQDMVGKTYKITATSAYTPTVSTFVDVVVLPKEAAGVGGGSGGSTVVDGELDGKKYIDFGDNTYKEIRDDGTIGDWMCAGMDETIGNYDDRSDVIVLEDPTDYGTKFLGPYVVSGGGTYYLAAGPDGKIGNHNDIKVVSKSTFPNDLTDIIATSITITVPEEITGDSNRVKPGKYYRLSAQVMNGSSPSVIQDVTWSLEGETAKDESTRIGQDGRLYIGGNEPEGTTITVKVQAKGMNGDPLTKTVSFTVRDWELSDLASAPTGTITTVEIDGTDFYLLVRNGDQGLIWAKNSVTSARFYNNGSSELYEGSDAQGALATWLESQSTLKTLAQEYTIYTREGYQSQNFITSTNQKAFLLSEADVFNTFNNGTPKPNDYTYAGKPLVAVDNPVKYQLLRSDGINWLRSMAYGGVNYISESGVRGQSTSLYSYGLRPALWISLSAQG